MLGERIRVTVDDRDGQRRARVLGDLDVFSSQTLVAHALTGLPDTTTLLVIDLRDVSFVDSAGVSALVKLHREATSRAIDVRALLGGARRSINPTIVDVLQRVMRCDDDADVPAYH